MRPRRHATVCRWDTDSLRPAARRHSAMAGLGLIEVLISLVVLAFGLLGLAALQGKAQRAELESYQRGQAMVLVEDMASRLRAAGSGAAENYVDEVGYESGFTDEASCAGGAGAARDLSCWHLALIGEATKHDGIRIEPILHGRGCITKESAGTLVGVYWVSVAWEGLSEVAFTGDDDPRKVDACGENLFGDESDGKTLRRTVRLPVLFAEGG